MSERRAVEVSVPVADGSYLNVTRELETFGVRIGAWYVTLEGGYLVVRGFGRAINEDALLKVPA